MRIGDVLRNIPMSEVLFTQDDFEHYNKISARELLLQIVQAMYLLCSAYMLWLSIAMACNSSAPVVVVLSESMYPGFHRGDILLLANWRQEYYTGDICVFDLTKDDIPIVHRIINKKYSKEKIPMRKNVEGADSIRHLQYMTKGDNNSIDDTFLYRKIQKKYLDANHLSNVVYASFPLIGMVTIWTGAYSGVKYLIIFIFFIDIVFTRDNTLKIAKIEEEKEKEKEDKDKKKK